MRKRAWLSSRVGPVHDAFIEECAMFLLMVHQIYLERGEFRMSHHRALGF